MAEQAYAYVTLIPVAKGFQREIAKELAGVAPVGEKAGITAGDNFKQGFKDAMSKGPSLGQAIAGVFGTLGVGGGLFLKSATDAASAFFAEFEGVNQIFGDAAPRVQAFADEAARLVGLSETAALQASKNFGVFATSAGLGGAAAADFSVDLVKAAGDLASFNDVPVEDTLAAIRSGLQGQGEPLSRFGILMNEGLLKTKAFEKGITDNIDNALTPQQRVLAANALILDELGVAQGDFVNYSDTYGNAIKTITATFSDLQAEIGLAVMPAIERMTVAFRDSLMQIQDPTTDLGESWNELIGTFEAFGETLESVFGRIDVAEILSGILDVVQMLVNGFSQLIYIGGDVGDILGRIFSGDFMGAGQQASTFFTRYNKFVDGLYQSADNAAAAARARAAASGFGPMTGSGGTLDFLQSLGFGGVETTKRVSTTTTSSSAKEAKDMTDAAKKLINDTREAFKEARSEYAKEVKEIQADFAERQMEIGETYDETVADATKRFNKRQIKIGESYNESVADATKSLAKRQADIGKRYNDKVADVTDRFNKQSVKIIKNYDSAVLQANKKRDEGLSKALTDHNKRIADIQNAFAQRQASIIQQSMDRLRDAYRSAVQINVASIFDSDQIAGSVDGLVQTLRDKLLASRRLVDNAAKLSSAGFSQTFIEQVVGAGTDVGNELAESLLNSTPETIAELKNLYGEIEKQSETGLDSLSKQIYEQTGLATTELKNLYAATEQELIDSLAVQNSAYQQTVATINAEFEDSIAASQIARDEALADAQNALDEAITKAKEQSDEALADSQIAFDESISESQIARDKALAESQEALDEAILDAKERRDEALQETEEDLQAALLRAAENFQDDIERIEKAFKSKIASMKGAISGLSAEIAGVNRALNMAEARVAITISGLETAKLTPFAEGGLVTGPTAALIGEAGPEVVIPLDRFDSMMNSGQPAVNYYAAPNQSLDSEQELFQAMKRAKVVVGW